MNVQEFYEKIGGSYEDALKRLPGESFVMRILPKFLMDDSYDRMVKGIEAGDLKAAFEGAHTLKGVTQNLALVRLGESSAEISDAFKFADSLDSVDYKPMLERVTADYNMTVEALKELAGE